MKFWQIVGATSLTGLLGVPIFPTFSIADSLERKEYSVFIGDPAPKFDERNGISVSSNYLRAEISEEGPNFGIREVRLYGMGKKSE